MFFLLSISLPGKLSDNSAKFRRVHGCAHLNIPFLQMTIRKIRKKEKNFKMQKRFHKQTLLLEPVN